MTYLLLNCNRPYADSQLNELAELKEQKTKEAAVPIVFFYVMADSPSNNWLSQPDI